MYRFFSISLLLLFITSMAAAQTVNDSTYEGPKFKSYQIYLKKEVKEIKEIQYFKDCSPINGTISQGKKTIIMDDYVPGNKVYMQLIYIDGSEEEVIRAPCFIDPVI